MSALRHVFLLSFCFVGCVWLSVTASYDLLFVYCFVMGWSVVVCCTLPLFLVCGLFVGGGLLWCGVWWSVLFFFWDLLFRLLCYVMCGVCVLCKCLCLWFFR